MVDWPNSFIYVCNATQASIVNFLPIIHAGIDRIAEVVVFCGARGSDVRDVTLRREAINPARQLATSISKLGDRFSPLPRVHILYGDAESFSAWTVHMGSICAKAHNKSLPVIYNVTGGRKPMSVGAIIGGNNLPQLIYVGGTPLRTEFLTNKQQVLAPRNGELSLDQYLSIYGIQELERAEREKAELFYKEYQQQLVAFGEALIPHGVMLIPQLHRLVATLNSTDGKFRPGIIDLVRAKPDARPGLSEAIKRLVGIPGIELVSEISGDIPSVSIQSQRVYDLLSGHWFEGYLYLKLIDAFAGRNDISIGANVRLSYSSSDGNRQKKERGEIDVAIMVRSQLHIIEAKVGSFIGKSTGRSEQSLAQTESLKRHLLGHFGHTFVINPRETKKWLAEAPGDFLARAENAGIDLLLGRDCLRNLINHVGRL